MTILVFNKHSSLFGFIVAGGESQFYNRGTSWKSSQSPKFMLRTFLSSSILQCDKTAPPMFCDVMASQYASTRLAVMPSTDLTTVQMSSTFFFDSGFSVSSGSSSISEWSGSGKFVKLIFSSLTASQSKLECFSLANCFGIVEYLRVRKAGHTKVLHLVYTDGRMSRSIPSGALCVAPHYE